MKPALLFFFFSWACSTATAELHLTKNLQNNLKDGSPWLVLGLVADSETQSSITPKGQELRKELEQIIQSMGGEVLPLPLSRRMKLERMWSLPYLGTFNDELKEEAIQLKANVLTGSFNPQAKGELQILTFDIQNKKTLVHYCKLSPPSVSPSSSTEDQMAPIPATRQRVQQQPLAAIIDNNPWGLETFEPTRQKPDERARRRTRNPRATEARNKLIQDHLNNNEVLSQFKAEHQQQSTQELISLRNNFIQRAQSSFMTSSKIELYSRAYAINTLIKPIDQQTEEKLLDILQDHQEFFLERKN